MSTVSLATPIQQVVQPAIKETPTPGVDSAMKKASEHYYHVSPFLDATVRALGTSGNRIDKFDAGTAELASRLGMRFFNTWYQKMLQKQYDKNPRFARFVDNHPIMFGFPLIIATSALCSYAGDLTKKGFIRLYNATLRAPVKKILSSTTADVVLKPLGHVNTWFAAGMKHPWFKVVLASVSMASSVAFVTHIALNHKLEKSNKPAEASTTPDQALPQTPPSDPALAATA